MKNRKEKLRNRKVERSLNRLSRIRKMLKRIREWDYWKCKKKDFKRWRWLKIRRIKKKLRSLNKCTKTGMNIIQSLKDFLAEEITEVLEDKWLVLWSLIKWEDLCLSMMKSKKTKFYRINYKNMKVNWN
jgi:hypothetical protein